MIDTIVSHYRILEKLGDSRTGELYLAADTTIPRKVIIEILAEANAADPEQRRRFIEQAGNRARLSHPNIATLLEVQDDARRPFIVMEFVEGRGIDAAVKADQPALHELLELIIQAAEGLEAAHAQGSIHGDIRPDNLIVTAGGKVKLLGVGLTGLESAPRAHTARENVAYLAPEQAQSQPIDRRSDIFSLGVVLYELLCNRRPFDGEDEQAVLDHILHSDPAPVSRYCRDAPAALEQFLSKCLAKPPEERYQTASDLLADLRKIRRDLESEVSQGGAAVRRRRRAPFILTGLGVLLVAALYVVFNPIKWKVVPDPGAIAAENALAVLYFDNLANPDDTDRTSDMLTSLLIADLSQSQYMRVTNRQRLLDILQQIGHGDSPRIDPTTAKQVVEKAAVRYVVTGEILRPEPALVVTVSLAEAESGRSLGAHRVEAGPGEDVFAVADKLGESLRADLKLPAAARSEVKKPLTQVATSSPEAYRYYLEGLDQRGHYNWQAAAESFQHAVSLDSTFAMAYLALSGLWQYKTSATRGKSDPLELAIKYADRCSWREQQMIKCASSIRDYEQSGGNKDQEAIEILNQVVKRYPDDKEAYYQLGRAALWSYNPDNARARAALGRALELDPQYRPALRDLAYLYAYNLKYFDSALTTIGTYELLVPDDLSTCELKSDVLCEMGDYEQAIAALKRALAIDPDHHDATRSIGLIRLFCLGDYEAATKDFQTVAANGDRRLRRAARFSLALVPLWRGQFQRGIQMLDQGIGADEMEGWNPNGPLAKRAVKITALMELGDWKTAESEAAIFGEKSAMTFREMLDIELWARQGELSRADSALQSYRKLSEGWGDLGAANYWYLAGVLKEAQGDAEGAAACYDSSHARTKPNLLFGSRFMLGRALLKTGELGRATELLKQALKTWDDATMFCPWCASEAHYYLGQAYEQSGWEKQAIEEYQRFLDIWSEADSGLAIVGDARARLAALKP